jgi:hypothetical protein
MEIPLAGEKVLASATEHFSKECGDIIFHMPETIEITLISAPSV